MGFADGFGDDLVLDLEGAVHDPHQRDNTKVIVKPGINDQSLEWSIHITLRRGHFGNQLLKQIFQAHPRLGTAGNSVAGIETDNILNFRLYPFRFRLGQIHFVEHRNHFQTLGNGGIAIGHRLGFYPLSGVHHQQRTFTGRQGAGHLIGEVHMSGGVDKVQLVGFTIPGFKVERDTLGLDGDATLALDIHGIEHLITHLTGAKAPAYLDKAVGDGGFAMVDMGDDGEIADMAEV